MTEAIAGGFVSENDDIVDLPDQPMLKNRAFELYYLPPKVIYYEELKQMIAKNNIQLYDVRQPEEVAEGKIPTSVNIPLGQVETALKMSAGSFQEIYNSQKPKKEDPNIVFHCQSGIRSLTALETARNLGYSKARHYQGGYVEWVEHEGLGKLP